MESPLINGQVSPWVQRIGEIVSPTIDANEVLAPIHDRMPVILPRSAYYLWLDPGIHAPKRLEPLLVPFPAEAMEAYPVSRLVNDPRNDVAECVKPLRENSGK